MLVTAAKTLRFITQHPLNRDRPWRAVRRYLAWQIASRLAPGAIAADWVAGTRLLASPGDAGVTGNIYCGLFDYEEMVFLLHILRPGDRFADVGANGGAWTVLACGAAGADGMAFEPAPLTYRKLVDNIQLNGLGRRVQAHNIAIGECRGTVRLSTGLDSMNCVVAADSQVPSVDVAVDTLDAIVGANVPTLMKVDVEGFETAVLRGAMRTLANPGLQAIVIELIGCGSRYNYDEAAIVRLLTATGFCQYRYVPHEAKLVPGSGASAHPGNCICVRNMSWIQERLATRREFSVFGKMV